jgi:hypothetical protein
VGARRRRRAPENGDLGTSRRAAAAAVAQSSPLETETAHSSSTGLGENHKRETQRDRESAGGKAEPAGKAAKVPGH